MTNAEQAHVVDPLGAEQASDSSVSDRISLPIDRD
jgi:hypothetical protein